MLLSREEVDHLMNDIFAYAEDAKNVLTGMNPQLNKLTKGLNGVTNTLNKYDPANPSDLSGLSTQVGETASGLKEAQDGISEAISKLDGSLGALSQLYRNLSKLTI